jgi:hypothetical protein
MERRTFKRGIVRHAQMKERFDRFIPPKGTFRGLVALDLDKFGSMRGEIGELVESDPSL